MNETPDTPPSALPATVQPSAEPPRWGRYVAIGDSFSEGLWDHPSEVAHDVPGERVRGWTERLAVALSRRRTAAGLPALQYADLAIRGKLLGQIVAEQLEPALALKPDLISIVGGGNDVLRPKADLDQLIGLLESAISRARSQGADVLLVTGFRVGEHSILAATNGRTAQLNAALWAVAQRHGAFVADTWTRRVFYDARLWASDRIHLLPAGHAKVADAALVALGQAPEDPHFADLLPPRGPRSVASYLRGEAEWTKEYVGPWINRRLHGTSSGDGRASKDSQLREV